MCVYVCVCACTIYLNESYLHTQTSLLNMVTNQETDFRNNRWMGQRSKYVVDRLILVSEEEIMTLQVAPNRTSAV